MTELFNITVATDNETLLDTSAYDKITESFSTDDPFKNIIEGSFQSLFGNYYDLGIFVVIAFMLYMMWQDQRSAIGPTVIIILLGSFIFTILPSAIVVYLKLFATMAMAGIVVKLYMDRR